jgi:hypothetical protein
MSSFAMEIPNGKLQEICGQANAQRNGGSAELRHRAEPAGAPPRCGRRQCIRNTNLDDEWIVGIGHARARIAAEIPTRCRTEEFGWRSAYDCAEIMEQIRLIGMPQAYATSVQFRPRFRAAITFSIRANRAYCLGLVP